MNVKTYEHIYLTVTKVIAIAIVRLVHSAQKVERQSSVATAYERAVNEQSTCRRQFVHSTPVSLGICSFAANSEARYCLRG
jgi:hypothetical protein